MYQRSTMPCFMLSPTMRAQEIEEKDMVPELYPYGSRGPVGSHYLAAKHGVRWGDNLSEEEQ